MNLVNENKSYLLLGAAHWEKRPVGGLRGLGPPVFPHRRVFCIAGPFVLQFRKS